MEVNSLNFCTLGPQRTIHVQMHSFCSTGSLLWNYSRLSLGTSYPKTEPYGQLQLVFTRQSSSCEPVDMACTFHLCWFIMLPSRGGGAENPKLATLHRHCTALHV